MLPVASPPPASLVELARVLRKFDGIYATHMRDEEDGVLEAVEEAITIAREAGVSLEISHLKVGYPRNWDKLDEPARQN